jgi:hypothetical protein
MAFDYQTLKNITSAAVLDASVSAADFDWH